MERLPDPVRQLRAGCHDDPFPEKNGKLTVKQLPSRAEAEPISVLSFRKWKSCGNSTYSET